MTDDDSVIVKLLDLPYAVHGLLRQNEDSSYTILLNSRDSLERNRQAYQHELKHLSRNDFQPGDVSVQEKEAHN